MSTSTIIDMKRRSALFTVDLAAVCAGAPSGMPSQTKIQTACRVRLAVFFVPTYRPMTCISLKNEIGRFRFDSYSCVEMSILSPLS